MLCSPQDDGENHYFCIRIIQTMFEYIFYRANLAYKKHEPNTNHGLSASMAISVLQFCMVSCVVLVFRGFFDFYLLQKNILLGKIITLGLIALLILYNYKHYTPKIKEMDEKFANHPSNKWLKDWLFFLLLILTSLSCIFFFPFLFIHLLKLILA